MKSNLASKLQAAIKEQIDIKKTQDLILKETDASKKLEVFDKYMSSQA